MKTISTIIILLSLSSAAFSETYRTYTAKCNGNFSNNSLWNAEVRYDNVKQNRYVIPFGLTVTADDADYKALGDIQIVIAGTLQIGASVEMELTSNSSIQLLAGGTVEGNGASQKILIGSVTKYQGNTDKLIAGPLFADSTTTGFSLFTTLSVEFVSFTAVNNDNTITLKWSTSAEVNNSHFEVEFSNNGRDWSKVGTVHAAANANSVSNYSFSYRNAGATASYRLKQIDKDGQFIYSDVVVTKNQSAAVSIFAANKTVHVELNGGNKTNMVVSVLNTNGRVIKSGSFSQVSGKIALDMNGLNAGNYVVHVSDNHSLQTVKSIMIF